MITLSYEGPIISKTYQIDVCIWGYRTCANIFDIPSVWAKRKLWDQNGAPRNSKTATPHSMKI